MDEASLQGYSEERYDFLRDAIKVGIHKNIFKCGGEWNQFRLDSTWDFKANWAEGYEGRHMSRSDASNDYFTTRGWLEEYIFPVYEPATWRPRLPMCNRGWSVTKRDVLKGRYDSGEGNVAARNHNERTRRN